MRGNPFVFLDPDTLLAPAPVIGETMYLPGDALDVEGYGIAGAAN